MTQKKNDMKVILYFKFVIICMMLLSYLSPVKAQQTSDKVVKDFGEALSSWCNTGESTYREKIEELCNGIKECRVEDKIHAEYQKERGLTNYETFVLDSYLNMFESLMSKSVNYQMSNIKVVGTDEMPEGTLTFVTVDINLSGAINKQVTDLFLIRNDKITGIYSYSSNLGFSHLNGSLINALKIGRYSWAANFKNGFARVANEAGNAGLIDTTGNVVIPCIWNDIAYNGGDFAWGFNYKDESNKKSVTYDLRADGKRTPLYRVQDYIVGREEIPTTFSEDYAVVYNEEKEYGFLNQNDQTYTVQYMFDHATRFCDGYAFVKSKYAGVGMIIDKYFNPILQDTKKTYTICDNLRNGLAKVKDRNTGKYGFINQKGELVIPCVYDKADYFSEGVCTVGLINGENKWGYNEYKYGCINTHGDIIIPIIYDAFWGCFENGYIEALKIKDGHSHGTLLGLDGKPLPGFSWQYDEVRQIHEGFARFEKDGKYGFLNAQGEVTIPPIYDFATFFMDGIACVSINDKYGKYKYGGINTDGILVIPCVYDDSFYFENGIALVQKGNQVGLIDKYGNSTFFLKDDTKNK